MYQQRQGQFQRRDQLAPAYNQGWQNHPGFRWGGGNQGGVSSSDNYQQRPTSNAIVPTEQKSGNTDTQAILKAIQEVNMTASSNVKELKGVMGNLRGDMGNIKGEMGNMSNNINALFQEIETSTRI